jgi:Rod binding domain-containing protein
MASIPIHAAPAGAFAALASPGGKGVTDAHAKARATAVDFEAVFLNSMFSQMFTGVEGDGPFGGGGATGVWRSFLSEEYAKTFAKAGGIGLADHVYRALITQQEARAA